MIYFFTAAAKFAPMRLYLKDWGAPLRRRVRIVAYEERPDPAAFPDASFVFADVDRLPPEATAIAVALWEGLAVRGERVRLLNDPRRALRRFALLRRLHQEGWNRFDVRRPGELRAGLRYPVFVRHALEHQGAYTPLLRDEAELDAALARLRAAGHEDAALMIVEFLDTRCPDGLYRKYAATIVGERILAHHVMFGREWEVKGSPLREPRLAEEERAFQLAHPHEARLRDLFALAEIGYGRVDYAVLDGALQVWEINTNPTLLMPPRSYAPERMPAKQWFSARLNEALLAIDDRPAGRRGWLGRLFGAPGAAC